jgi:foldase protein PrsA
MAAQKEEKKASSKKPAAKDTAPKDKTSGKPGSGSKSTGSSAAEKAKRMKLLKNIAIWLGVFLVTLVLVDYGVQYLNYKASVAIVNGERIMKGDFYEQLEDTYGATIVSQMIDERLIFQEAEKENVTVSDEEINDEISELQENYGGEEALQSELDARGISDEKLREQIETTLIVEKMLVDSIEITEEEKKEFFEEYKDVLFPEDEDPTYEEAEEKITQTLRDQKLSQEVQTWLAELREDSNIRDNVTEPKDIQFLGITRDFISELGN